MGCGGSRTKEDQRKNMSLALPKCRDTIAMEKSPSSLAPISDKEILVGVGKEVNKLDLSSHKLTPVFTEHEKTVNFMIKLSNGLYASACQDKTIKIWDLQTSKCKGTLSGHKCTIWGIAECSDGTLISVSDDKTAILWDINKCSAITTLVTEKKVIPACAVLKDGRVAIGCESVKVFNINKKEMDFEINLGFPVWSLLQLKNGDLAVGLGNGNIQLIDLNEKKSKHEFKGHTKCVNCLIELDGGRIISGGDDKKLIMWNIFELESMYELSEGHTTNLVSLVKLDDFRFVSASEDSIKIWE